MVFIAYLIVAVILCVAAFLGYAYLLDVRLNKKIEKDRTEFNRNIGRFSEMTKSEQEEFVQGTQRRAAEATAIAEAAKLRVEDLSWGKINPHLICPHCQKIGYVRTKNVDKKTGISGSKATAAILTGGASILVAGLSQKEGRTQARCGVCKSTWLF